MTSKFGNAEMHYIPMEEVHTPHTWWCCWNRTAKEIGIGAAIFISLVVMWIAYWAVALA